MQSVWTIFHSEVSNYSSTKRVLTNNFSDVLQRHISRHAAVVETTERNKRACKACHKAKTRCAGGIPCQLCSKKGIPCRLDSRMENQPLSSYVPQNTPIQEKGMFVIPNGENNDLDISNMMDIDNAVSSPEMVQQLTTLPIFHQPSNASNVSENAQALPRIQKTNSGYLNRPHAHPLDVEAGELYFSDFQPRWPVIHGPSYDERGAFPMLNHSILMIGNWLKGTVASRNEAIEAHNRLVDDLFARLVRSLHSGMLKYSNVFE
jgi:hypothetical protein